MITPTLSTQSFFLSRKRNRHEEASSFPSITAHHGPTALGTSSGLFHHLDTNNTNTNNTTFVFTPSHKNYNAPPTTGQTAAASAAAVSPFIDRRRNNNNFLSQDSIASSVTYGSNGNAAGGNVGGGISGENAAESSSVGMDHWSSGSIGDFHSDCSGNRIGGTVDREQRVGCSFGGDLPSSISTESYANHQFHTQQEFLPPMKRARMDYGPDMTSASIMEEDDSMDTPSSPTSSVMKKMGLKNGMNYNMNIDKMDGRRRCCHVCSTEEDNTNHKDHKECRIATTTNKSPHAHPSHAALAPSPFKTTSAPRSHSLLNFFQLAKKQSPPPKTKNHEKRETTTTATSLHHHVANHVVGTVAPSNLSQCRYCDKLTCSSCTRQCIRCQHRFCTFCTKVDYDSSVEERIMCFDCDYEYGCGNANGEDGDCDMMDL